MANDCLCKLVVCFFFIFLCVSHTFSQVKYLVFILLACFLLYSEVLQVRNLPIDWLSFILLIWNFGGAGVIAIHWKAPLRLQQAYLIFCSALTVSFRTICSLPYVLCRQIFSLSIFQTGHHGYYYLPFPYMVCRQ